MMWAAHIKSNSKTTTIERMENHSILRADANLMQKVLNFVTMRGDVISQDIFYFEPGQAGSD